MTRAAGGTALVEVRHLKKHFHTSRRRGLFAGPTFSAVDDVSLAIRSGETLGLVGESGSGKSTLARCIVRLIEPSDGTIRFDGCDITHGGATQLRPLRRRMQMMFQDPMTSLNPLKTAGRIVADALAIQKIGARANRRSTVATIFNQVGLRPDLMDRLPGSLSGGQRQRVGIARALALSPDLIVADEPVSALDVSVQADILNLLADLRRERGMTYLFISHDLGVIRHVSDRVGVMYLGKLVEIAPAESFFRNPLHRYSEALLAAMPDPDPTTHGQRRRVLLQGDITSPIAPPPGCRFHPRYRYSTALCRTEAPAMERYGVDHYAACHHPNIGQAPQPQERLQE